MKNKREIYQAMQAEWVSLTGIQKGDHVKVVREYKDCEQGFIGGGHPPVGTILTYNDEDKEGIVTNGFNLPYFVLEVVEKPKELQLNGDSPRIVSFNGNVKCGCFDVSKEEAKKIAKLYNALSEAFAKYSFSINVEGTEITRDDVKKITEVIS